MNQASTLSTWLEKLGKLQNCKFKLDEQYRCSIKANNDISLVFFGPSNSDRYYINIELIAISANTFEQTFKTALSLNLSQQNLLGSAIGIDEKAQMLALSYSKMYSEQTFEEFKDTIDQLIDISSKLINQLSDNKNGNSSNQVLDHEIPAFAIQI